MLPSVSVFACRVAVALVMPVLTAAGASAQPRGTEGPAARPSAAWPAGTARGMSATAAADLSRIRREQKLPPLAADATLASAAQRQADAMAQAGRMSHDVAGSFSSRIQAAGIRAGRAAENVAAGQNGWAEVLRDWMASPGHRSNILMVGISRVGVARSTGAGGPYWALIVAGPEPAPRRAPEPQGAWPFGAFGVTAPATRP